MKKLYSVDIKGRERNNFLSIKGKYVFGEYIEANNKKEAAEKAWNDFIEDKKVNQVFRDISRSHYAIEVEDMTGFTPRKKWMADFMKA